MKIKYLKITERLYEEYRCVTQHPTPLKDFRLPDGNKNASRLYRKPDGTLQEEAPWLLADLFSL